MTHDTLAPLDYSVEIPRLIPLVIKDDYQSPRYLGRFDHVPLFGEYTPILLEEMQTDYGDFVKDSYTLRELVVYFEKFVALVANTTKQLREPDIQDWEREALIDAFYGEDTDWGNVLSPRNNYYYAQSVPELRAVEVALFFLSSPDYPQPPMDVTEVRQRIDALKLRLWQCLPDFYKAHEYPISQPVSYRSDDPYPLFHITDNFIKGLRPTIPIWVNTEDKKEAERYLSDVSDSSRIDRLSFEVDSQEDIIIKSTSGQSFVIYTDTAVADPHELITMIQDMIMLKDPAHYEHDPEGDVHHFTTMSASNPKHVKLAIYFMPYSAKEYNYRHVSGLFDRRQLANDLIQLCRLMDGRVELGFDEEWLKRLESIM